jgi:hypothetical protein
MTKHVNKKCDIWNLCGPAETTLQSLFHAVNVIEDIEAIPLGKPLPNYHGIIQDNYTQPAIIGQEGELLVGGVGIFAGYLGRDDLTEKALIEIDGEVFYRTGDLVRIDENGLLYYQGRKDHQIKLHGQRIELGEIERCLLSTSISACVVMKSGEDHLVAYVQSSDVNVEQLRKHCRLHLPPHMIPSKFIVLKQFPLNPNGKIDRKRLPTPEFSSYPSGSTDDYNAEPNNELERHIHSLWCQVLSHTRIPTNSSFSNIGGHSLLLVQLYHKYKMTFNVHMTNISIAKFLQYPTIADHARLLNESMNNQEKNQNFSSSINATEGKSRYEICSTCSLKWYFFSNRRNVFHSRIHAYRLSE